jgi:hypothetical protein
LYALLMIPGWNQGIKSRGKYRLRPGIFQPGLCHDL